MILHGNFLLNEGIECFFLWGESPAKNKTKSNTKTVIPLFPGIENIRYLASIIDDMGVIAEKIILVPKKYFVTSQNVNPDDCDLDELLEYRINGFVYYVKDMVSLMQDVEHKYHKYKNIELSEEMRYWLKVFNFTCEMAIKHRYYPNINCDDKLITTKWDIFLETSEDKSRLNTLIKNNPPLTRAYFDLKEKDFIPYTKKEIVDQFISFILDHYIQMIDLNTNALIEESNGTNKKENNKSKITGVDPANPLIIWVNSLFTQSKIELDENLVIKIKNEYNKWFEPLLNGSCIRRFILCFKVIQPFKNSSSDWHIEFMLQDSEDKSLIFSVAEIWNKSQDISKYFNDNYLDPAECLIEDLNYAARVYPLISRSFNDVRPTKCVLNSDEIYDFMVNYSKILQDNGFHIIVPSFWYEENDFKVDLTAKEKKSFFGSKSAVNANLDLQKVLKYDWKIALGDIEISNKEFKQLAMLKLPIINLRGRWIHLTNEQMQGFKQLWIKRHDKDIKMDELLKHKLNKEDFVPGLKINNIKCAGNIKTTITALADFDNIEDVEIPKNLKATLRDYQVKGFSWMKYLSERNIGACLADDMGLGKTIQLITLLLYEREQSLTTKPTLLVCPTSLIGNWKKEIEKFAPTLDVLVHHGSNRKHEKEFEKQLTGKDVVLTTYALAQIDEKTINRVDWSGLVLDEAQNIKNSYTKQTKSIKQIPSDYKIALTGTPVENKLSELWSIVDFLNSGYLGNHKEFVKNFANPIESGKESSRVEVLKNLVSPFILRRLKTDPNIIKDLPEKNEMKVYCNLTREQASLYEAVISSMLQIIEKKEGIERKGMVLSALGSLKQICNHPAHFLKDGSELSGRSGKLNMLLEMLEKIIKRGDKTLIFTQFAEMGKFIEKAILDNLQVKSLFLHGNLRRNSRDNMVKIFQSDDMEYPIFILSLKAGGVGITLTKANHVFHFDRWWNPAVENQATDRAFRLGQMKNVQVYKFICAGTLEEKIDLLIDSKKSLAESIVGTSEEWVTEMSNDELKNLLKLDTSELIEE